MLDRIARAQNQQAADDANKKQTVANEQHTHTHKTVIKSDHDANRSNSLLLSAAAAAASNPNTTQFKSHTLCVCPQLEPLNGRSRRAD